MILPPGLTCVTCRLGLRDGLARRTNQGYVHARPCVSPTDLTDLPGRWVNVRGINRWVA